jgi:hypothetical protein
MTDDTQQGGFTLIEALIALSIMMVGLLSLAQVMGRGMVMTAGSPIELIAKEKAVSAVESVFTARDTRVLTWNQIRNVNGGVGGGIFLDGPQEIRQPGIDGMVGTADDATLEGTVTPGADGQLGTEDDGFVPMTRMTREIEIRELNPVNLKLRQLRVIVRYQVGGAQREYVLTTFISSYA